MPRDARAGQDTEASDAHLPRASDIDLILDVAEAARRIPAGPLLHLLGWFGPRASAGGSRNRELRFAEHMAREEAAREVPDPVTQSNVCFGSKTNIRVGSLTPRNRASHA